MTTARVYITLDRSWGQRHRAPPVSAISPRFGEDEVLDVVSKAQVEDQLNTLVKIERQQLYQWATADIEAENAIVVRIGGTTAAPIADVLWEGRSTFPGGAHINWPVPEALDRAHELGIMMDYPRVVVTLQEVGMWRPEWGRLAEKEGYY